MKTIPRRRFHGFAIALALASCQIGVVMADTPIYAGFREVGIKDVQEGQQETLDDFVIQSAEGSFYKTGKGALTVPLGAFQKSPRMEIGVREGSISLTAGQVDASIAVPETVLNRAELWFDVSAQGKARSCASGITHLYDARETSIDSPTRYYMESRDAKTSTGCPTLGMFQDRTGLYFGGFGSGLWMKLMKGGSDTQLKETVTHVFLVQGVNTAVGYFLGNENIPFCYIPESANLPNGCLTWPGNGERDLSTFSGRMFINGKWVDPTVERSSTGWRLYEVKHFLPKSWFSNFFNYYNNAGNCGGDYIGECLVFTEPLTETERLQVETYLMDKWSIVPDRGMPRVTVADGATAEVSASTASAIEIRGEGRIERKDSGSLTLVSGGAASDGFHGTLRANDGCTTYVQGDETGISLKPGQQVDAVTDYLGERLIMAATTADVAEKRGVATVRMRGTEPGVKTVKVVEGELVLGGEKRTTLLPGSDVAVAIENGSFEDKTDGFTDFNRFDLPRDGAKYAGWYGVGGNTGLSVSPLPFFWNGVATHLDWGDVVWGVLPVQHGSQCAGIQQNGGLYTYVDIPQDGDYQLSFDISGRSSGCGLTVDVMMGDTWADAVRVGSSWGIYLPFPTVTLKLRGVKAGRKVLGFVSTPYPDQNNATTCIDDVRLRLIGEADAQPAAYVIPNGDFEQLRANTKNAIAGNGDPDLNTGAEGWVLSKVDPSFRNNEFEQPVMIALPNMRLAHPYNTNGSGYLSGSKGDICPCDQADVVWGQANLALFGNQGVATTTFTPPAGTYRLKGRIAAWRFNAYSGQLGDCTGIPQFEARVTIGAQNELSLGTVTTSAHRLGDAVWSKAFTVDGSEPVTLKIGQIAASGSGIVDDLVLIDASETNFLKDGGFENNDGSWTYVTPEGHSATAPLPHGDSPDTWGYAQCEGRYRLRLTGGGKATQQLVIPNDGYYRLSFFTSSRYDTIYGSGTGLGKVPLAMWLESGAAKQLICEVRADSSNYLHHAVAFHAKAGTYTFGIEGDVSAGGHASFVDAISIAPMSADDLAAPVFAEPDVAIEVSNGAKLRLEYSGVVQAGKVKLGGRNRYGTINAATHPDFICGPGALYVEEKGMRILVR